MSYGRHAAPPEHHVARAGVGVLAVAGLGTGGLMAITPEQVLADRGSTIQEDAPATQPMQRITLPVQPAALTSPATRYTVKPGDTLSGIGAAAGEPWQTVYADNAGTIGPNPDRIQPGQVLLLDSGPATQPIAVPVAAPAVSVGRHATIDGADVVARAESYVGVPYVWGGSTRAGMDCSGLVLRVFADLGVAQLPHSSLAQSQIGTRINGLTNAQPGDLVFFDNPVGHVGIYIGGGQMVAAPTFGDHVKVQSVYTTPTVIRRLV